MSFYFSYEMGFENAMNFILFKTKCWKYELISVIVLVLIVIYIKHKLSFWSRQLIPHEIISFNKWFINSINENDQKNAVKYGKVFGTYKFLTPVLCISDIKLIEKVMITDFHNFFEQRTWFVESQILENSLFASRYQQWKRQKSIISSAFYSRKLKLLKPIMDKSMDQLIQNLNSVSDSALPINVSEYFTWFSLYFMLSVVFDIEVGELSKFKHPIISSYKKFITKKINLAQSICFVHPFLAKIINLYFLSYKSIGKLRNLLEDAIETRDISKSKETIRAEINFIDILLEFESEFGDKNSSLSSQEVKDNLIALFIAATESIAKTLSYCIYYFASYPDLQEKVYNEVYDKINNQMNINWETLRELTFTEAFIKEVLRFTTPFPRFERIVKKDFHLETEFGNILLPKDSIVSVLASAVHMDEDYFKDSKVFNPNRFLPEYNHLMNPKAFIPFANGPRNCIGMKYAFFHIKHCLAHLLLNFKIEAINVNKKVNYNDITSGESIVRFVKR